MGCNGVVANQCPTALDGPWRTFGLELNPCSESSPAIGGAFGKATMTGEPYAVALALMTGRP